MSRSEQHLDGSCRNIAILDSMKHFGGFYPSKMYMSACKQVIFNHLSGRNEQNYRSSPVLTYSKRALFVRHAMTCHTPCKTLMGAIIWPVRYRCNPLPTKLSGHLKSWSFCECVIYFFSPLRNLASPLNSVASNEKKTSRTRGSRWWSIQVIIWKTIHTTWVQIPGSGLNFSQALISLLKSLSMGGPGRRDTYHVTDFSQTFTND